MSSAGSNLVKPKRRQWFFAGFLLGVVLVGSAIYLVWANGPYTFNPLLGGWRKDMSLQGQGGVQGTHLEVHWPEKPIGKGEARPAVKLRIPREYADAYTTYVDEQGNITEVGVVFELPGPRPLQRGAARDPSVTRHLIKITPGGQGYALRMAARPRDCSSIRYTKCIGTFPVPPRYDGYHIPDVPVAGLERYSTVHCYPEKDLGKPDVQRYLRAKPADDTSPANCRLFRYSAVLISPPEVKAGDEGVLINCISGSCFARFSVADISMNMRIKYENLSRWQEFVEPARALARSFVVPDGVPTAFH